MTRGRRPGPRRDLDRADVRVGPDDDGDDQHGPGGQAQDADGVLGDPRAQERADRRERGEPDEVEDTAAATPPSDGYRLATGRRRDRGRDQLQASRGSRSSPALAGPGSRQRQRRRARRRPRSSRRGRPSDRARSDLVRGAAAAKASTVRCAVVPGPVEPPVHRPLDPPPQRLEQRGRDERGGGHRERVLVGHRRQHRLKRRRRDRRTRRRARR